MSHPQALRIPFQEFGFFTQPCRELSIPTSSHTHILEENLLMTCKSPKNSLPLHPIYNNDNNDLILFPMSKYSLKEKEGTIINQVREDFFDLFDCTKLIGNIDFAVAIPQNQIVKYDETEYILWAEAKQGNNHNIYESFIQLILTIGKERTFEKFLPPRFIGAFDAEKIAFIPYESIMAVFTQNDFNWNITPSDHNSKEFKQLKQMVRAELDADNKKRENVFIYYFGRDDKELRQFIRVNFRSGRDKIHRMSISQNNVVSVYNKWRTEVMPSIAVNWENAKQNGLLETDFFLADLIAEDNQTLMDGLHVLLCKTLYKLDRKIGTDGIFVSKEVPFKDNMQAHTQFWARYARPPKKEYWNKIVDRRDLLVPQDVRERKGSFFTPAIWVEKSQEYLANTLGENWQDEYYIWDCCAGTGNLLVGLNNKYNIWASTLDQADVKVMHERIHTMGAGSNLLESHVFQFDFLNDDFSKLPQSLQAVINDPEKRKKLVIYINPPYAEAASYKTVTKKGDSKKDVAVQNLMYKKYLENIGIAGRELFVQFFTRIYQEIPSCTLAEFSKLKILQAPNFADFRDFFQAKLRALFLMPADTFDNVKGSFPIGFYIWDTSVKEIFTSFKADIYKLESKETVLCGTKTLWINKEQKSINDWLITTRNRLGEKNIAFMACLGADFQHANMNYILNRKEQMPHPRGSYITTKNIIEASVYLAVRHCIEATWLNDRDQFLYPNDGWKTDYEFQLDCLAYTLFHGQNRISADQGANHWIPFYEHELDAPDNFASNFMADFIRDFLNGKHTAPATTEAPTLFDTDTNPAATCQDLAVTSASQTNAFSPEAAEVMQAGKALWYYYIHHKDNELYGKAPDINASFYDIRAYFQGRNDKGKMNSESSDEKYTALIKDLRAKQKSLAAKIAEKVYLYGFLK